MARPRGIADEELLAAAEDLLYAVGPAGFTLEKVAARAGVSAATLIKRFGSKRQLLLALNRRWVASIGPGLAAATEGRPTALGWYVITGPCHYSPAARGCRTATWAPPTS
jgi:AcrR family transcriptional regulator